MENLVECKRCGGNACYEQTVNETVKTWLCMGCGFTTSTLMEENSKVVKDLLEVSPELYKDLLFKDDTNSVWAPATITLPGKGMVFIDGNNKQNWQWAAVKAIPLTEEEKTSGRFPKEQEFKMDMQNGKRFNQKEFMDACEEIGFFKID